MKLCANYSLTPTGIDIDALCSLTSTNESASTSRCVVFKFLTRTPSVLKIRVMAFGLLLRHQFGRVAIEQRVAARRSGFERREAQALSRGSRARELAEEPREQVLGLRGRSRTRPPGRNRRRTCRASRLRFSYLLTWLICLCNSRLERSTTIDLTSIDVSSSRENMASRWSSSGCSLPSTSCRHCEVFSPLLSFLLNRIRVVFSSSVHYIDYVDNTVVLTNVADRTALGSSAFLLVFADEIRMLQARAATGAAAAAQPPAESEPPRAANPIVC